MFFSKFRKCIYISLRPYKLGLSKVVKLKTILLFFIQGKFRKCICISLKPYKLGLSKVVKLKIILLYFIQAEDLFCKVSL